MLRLLLLIIVGLLLPARSPSTTMVVGLSEASSSSRPSPQQPQQPRPRIALVTGANKGIGYEIVQKLGSEHLDNDPTTKAFVCILGCRDAALGRAAVHKLQESNESNNPTAFEFVRIDLLDHDSIMEAVHTIQQKYGRLDVLINNAAVCYNDPTLYGKLATPASFAEQAQITIDTNFFGTLAVTQAMLPLLLPTRDQQTQPLNTKNHSYIPRIINIASSAGRLALLPTQERREIFASNTLQLEELQELMHDFVKSAQTGQHVEDGWPNTGYGVSKIGIIALTKLFARRYGCTSPHPRNPDDDQSSATVEDDTTEKQKQPTSASPVLLINSVDPGYCATDQNQHHGTKSAARGATTPYLLATIRPEWTAPSDQLAAYTGKHWYEEHEIAW